MDEELPPDWFVERMMTPHGKHLTAAEYRRVCSENDALRAEVNRLREEALRHAELLVRLCTDPKGGL